MKVFFALSFLFNLNGWSQLNVVTTTTNLKSLVEYIGKDLVTVKSIAKGTQDPHFVEAKPSYTLSLRNADLLISVGLDLEIGWLPLVLRKTRSPKLLDHSRGHLILGKTIHALEIPTGHVSRSDGDVHPDGNPHFMLSPTKAIEAAKSLKDRLILLDSSNSSKYNNNFKDFQELLNKRIIKWKKSIPKNLKVVTYHKTLTYFYHNFGIENIDMLEPKPGIPPTAKHILSVIKKAKLSGVTKIIVENYFDSAAAKKVSRSIPEVKIIEIPVAVQGIPEVKNLLDLYDHLVRVFK